MKDRFKFRAWNTETKTMHYRAEQTYDCLDGIPLIRHSSFGDLLDDENYIVEQCTGIKDANGKLIYEGDIIFINGEKWQVIWNDEDCAFFFSNLKEVYHQPIFPDFYRMTDDFKVIGNMHENPELMK